MKTRKMTFIALLVAQGLVLHVIEGMLPIPFIAPGARLGLTNIITLMALYILDFNEILLVVVLRVLLSTLIAGNMSSFIYSIAGGIFSFLSMYTLKRIGKENVSIIGVSIVGAVFHNIGQVIVAGLIINNAMIVSYLPILLVAAIGTGIFVGITGKFLLPFIERLNLKG
ncbi:Gx transporter family protein [Clostridium massiliodielmoense]|uniref:Gx transporter family protein n=1 Tax=Clostridium massiliodielmoense TaxID=1776385 RepID=UPI0001666768|nr:Gx transporter family protein [Clostridium massiliodielmoense]EDS76775.1 heptaprenyl diphosphate synthase component I [Clostridium botulinum C str. Eklund]KEH98280.1 heptaprenyl diphosphate synthase [Clostridium botulinum C/D str. BKT12695]NEZ49357.1 Gx transporter family protein [Clostridium botulinum]